MTGLAPASRSWTASLAGINGHQALAAPTGNGKNTFFINNPLLSTGAEVVPGTGGDQVNILATSAPLWVPLLGGTSEVNIGNQGSLANIKGWISVYTYGGKANLVADDRADPTAQTGDGTKAPPTSRGAGPSAGWPTCRPSTSSPVPWRR